MFVFTSSNSRSVGTVRAFISHAEGWVHESRPRQAEVVTFPLPNSCPTSQLLK